MSYHPGALPHADQWVVGPCVVLNLCVDVMDVEVWQPQDFAGGLLAKAEPTTTACTTTTTATAAAVAATLSVSMATIERDSPISRQRLAIRHAHDLPI